MTLIKNRFTEEQLNEYISSWQAMKGAQLAQKYGVSQRTIRVWNKKLALKAKVRGKPKRDSIQHQQYKQDWITMSNQELAEKYGMSLRTVLQLNKDLGLRQYRAWKGQVYQDLIHQPVKPRNKRKDVKPVGTIVTRKSSTGYSLPHIQTEKGWVRLHIYNWTKAGNTIPEGHVLGFKDLNPCNCELDNLVLKVKGRSNKRVEGEHRRAKERKARTEAKRAAEREEIEARKAKRIKARAEKKRHEREKKEEARRLKEEQRQLLITSRKNRSMKREEKRFQTRQRDFSKMIPVRIDAKTIVYANSREDEERIRAKYSKMNPLDQFKKAS